MNKKKSIVIKNYIYMLVKITKISSDFVLVSVLLSILTTISPIVNILLLQYIINSLEFGVSFETIVYILVFFLLCITILSCVTTYFSTQILNPKKQKILLELKNEIFVISEGASLETYDNPEYYDSLAVALRVAEEQAVGVVESFSTIISSLLSSGMLITLIISVEPMLIFLSIFSTVISFLYGVKSSKVNVEYIDTIAPINRKNTYIQNVFIKKESFQELKSSHSAELFLEHLKLNIEKLMDILTKQGQKLYCFFVQNAFFNNLTLLIIIGILSWKAIKCNVAVGNIVAALSSTQQLSNQLMTVSVVVSRIYQQGLIIGKYRNYICVYCKKDNKRKGNSEYVKNLCNPEIELKEVSFKFENAEYETLKKITLNIKYGEHVAFVGPNGSGKSTLVKLIAGLYFPTEGEIFVNGKEYKSFDIGEVQKLFSFVFQDFKIFALSIAENVLMKPFVNNRINRLRVESALKYVGLKEKVDSFPDGIYTELSKEFTKDGNILSGGELQKLSIARAFAQKRPIMIFDEATSALDIEAEKKLFLTLKEVRKETTMIWVTHRFECLQKFDKIYYMENGKIVEYGKFDDLIIKRGKFFNMFSNFGQK